jgi:ligand-binding sensor domain-containing protein/signal transduction histidine kinase
MVLHQRVRKLKRVTVFGLLMVVVGLVTACRSWTAPALRESLTTLGQEIPRTENAQGEASLRSQKDLKPSWTGSSSGQQVVYERVSLEQGLADSSVMSIVRDGRGFVWLGTTDGLIRYDGYHVKVYRPDPEGPSSLSHSVVSSVYEDRSGLLWIGTEGGGLNRYDRQNDRFIHYRHNPNDPTSLSHDFVSSIYEDQSGTLWIGTNGGGLNEFVRGTQSFVRFQHVPQDPGSLSSDYVLSIFEDRSGMFWVGTSNGLNRFDQESERFAQYRRERTEADSKILDEITTVREDQSLARLYLVSPIRGFNEISSIYEDRLGVLWVGTFGGGLRKFDREKKRFTQYQHDLSDPHSLSDDVIWQIHEDQAGLLWIATNGGGLDRFDRESEQFIHYRHNPSDPQSLSSNRIRSLYEDPEGVLWIGTFGGGLNKRLLREGHFAHYEYDPQDSNSLSDNSVFTIYEYPSGVLWIGTDKGLDRLERDTGRFDHYQNNPTEPDSLSHNLVRSIYHDQEGFLWIGTLGGGLNRFDPESKQFLRYQHDPNEPGGLSNDNVLALYQDRSGILWVGTLGGGLNRFDPVAKRFAHYRHNPSDPNSLGHDVVRTVFQDREGVLWVGTDAGLDRLNADTGSFDHYQNDPSDPHSLSHNLILSISQDQAGALWIGTYGGGLNKFDRQSETFIHYGPKDGLPGNDVYGVLEDGWGNLWLSTSGGLAKFNPRTQTFRAYDASDGLQNNEFNVNAFHRSSSGEMFFGGVNGFSAFYPDRIPDNLYVPPVVLTSLTQGGDQIDLAQPLESTEEVTLRWPKNFFEFEFTALSYVQPEKNQYAYRLEGFDTDWNYIGTKRFGRYTNLPGGTFTLRLRGSNNDGTWNEEALALKLIVIPPIWSRWWFRGAVVLGLVVIVAGGYQMRLRSIRARSSVLEKQVQERTSELSRINELLTQEITERKRAEEALAQQAAEAAVAAERSRLARDLHDSVTQTLFSASLIAEAFPTIWKSDQVEGGQLLKEMQRLSRGALAEMRTLLLELRPTVLVEASLDDLLHQLVEAITGRKDISAVVTVEGDGELPPDVHVAFYRIAQEALNNVVKHAYASHVAVSLRWSCPQLSSPASLPPSGQKRGVELCVSDDGCGFDERRCPPDRLGLRSMRERAQAVGARLDIESRPGHGTRITVLWKG